MKVKTEDVSRAVGVLKEDYLQTTGLTGGELSEAAAVFDEEAETVTCPACTTRFKPTLTSCPDCGLQFG